MADVPAPTDILEPDKNMEKDEHQKLLQDKICRVLAVTRNKLNEKQKTAFDMIILGNAEGRDVTGKDIGEALRTPSAAAAKVAGYRARRAIKQALVETAQRMGPGYEEIVTLFKSLAAKESEPEPSR